MTDYKPYYENSSALIVGINSYTDPRFRTLQQAETDAEAFAKLLANEPYNFEVTTLFGIQATKRAIQQELSSLRKTLPNDRIIIYLACHGYTIEDRRKRETGYLACADTIPDEEYTALPLDDVTNLRNYAAAKHILFVFDACYSGRALGLGRSVGSIAADRFRTQTAYQALAAGNVTVADYPSMTSYMLELLSTDRAVDPNTKLCTLISLGSQLTHIIGNTKGLDQIPISGHLEGSDAGQFVFYDRGGDIPIDIEQALHSSISVIRQGGVLALANLLTDAELSQKAEDVLQRIASEDSASQIRELARDRLASSLKTKHSTYRGYQQLKVILLYDDILPNALCITDEDLIVGEEDGIRVLDLESFGTRTLLNVEARPTALAYIPFEDTVISVVNGHLLYWDTKLDASFYSHPLSFIPYQIVQCTDNKFAFGSSDGKIRLGSYVTVKSGFLNFQIAAIGKHNQGVAALAVQANGDLLASSSYDGTLCLWDVKTQALVQELHTQNCTGVGLAFSPNGLFLASANVDHTLRVWDTRNGVMLHCLEGHSLGVTGVAFSPDGSHIISSSDDRTLRLWDIFSGKVVEIIDVHHSPIVSVRWVHSRNLIISYSADRVMRISSIDFI
jgi:WD40 repeat protein